jgi:hypothetical protein
VAASYRCSVALDSAAIAAATIPRFPVEQRGIETNIEDAPGPEPDRESPEKEAGSSREDSPKGTVVQASSRLSKAKPAGGALERELTRARADGRWEDADRIQQVIDEAVVIDLAARRRPGA